MGRRFISKEVPRARVRATVLGQTVETRADAEGFFQARFELAGSSPGEALSDTGWHPVDLELLWPTARATISGGEVRERGWALVPVRAAFAVVSDLDDTVIQTGATSLLTMLRTVLLNDASTRLPFDGVAPFYEALRLGTVGTSENPIFYVSNGPWNLYDLTEEFLNLNGVPAGPIFLRDWGPFNLKDHRGKHKTGVIRSLLETYPDLRFVLVGDSGEADPEIYARVIKEHPDRIIAAYIRDVATSPKRDAAVRAIAEALLRDTGVEMLLVPDSGTAAEHAARIGLIPPDTPRLVHVATKS
jgi:phosphatidate phosphatase APP1